ncbi:DUF6461 domain-containing protein [Streptomyces sp. NPDC059918]|uniref:DUF6461 domain-containing protein n=1 Tax=unclassified Streptomyces TaxID=2593676 RepID=UPI00364A9BBF
MNNAGYSRDWVKESGLDLGLGHCITIVRHMAPRAALHRLGIADGDISMGTWGELTDRVYARGIQTEEVAMAAFGIGECTVVIEDLGYRGSRSEWHLPLSVGTEVVNVHDHPVNGRQVLRVLRDGACVAFLDSDAPEGLDDCDCDGDVCEALSRLLLPALQPMEDGGEQPADLDDGWIDFLQVACDYFGLRPTPGDVSGPALGAPYRMW